MLSKDEHPYDDRVEELEDVKKNDPDRKFLVLHRKEKWDREVKAKESSSNVVEGLSNRKGTKISTNERCRNKCSSWKTTARGNEIR